MTKIIECSWRQYAAGNMRAFTAAGKHPRQELFRNLSDYRDLIPWGLGRLLLIGVNVTPARHSPLLFSVGSKSQKMTKSTHDPDHNRVETS